MKTKRIADRDLAYIRSKASARTDFALISIIDELQAARRIVPQLVTAITALLETCYDPERNDETIAAVKASVDILKELGVDLAVPAIPPVTASV